MQYKMSKSDWNRVGVEAGWIKQSQEKDGFWPTSWPWSKNENIEEPKKNYIEHKALMVILEELLTKTLKGKHPDWQRAFKYFSSYRDSNRENKYQNVYYLMSDEAMLKENDTVKTLISLLQKLPAFTPKTTKQKRTT
jgi:hypothetical protein